MKPTTMIKAPPSRHFPGRRPPQSGGLRPLPVVVALAAVFAALGGQVPAAMAADAAPQSASSGQPPVKVAQVQFAEFDPRMLAGVTGDSIDLTPFNSGQQLVRGQYRADVHLNGSWLGRFDVRVAAPAPGEPPVPCLSPELLGRLNVEETHLSAEALALLGRTPDPVSNPAPGCLSLGRAVPDATASFDAGELKLELTVPQAYLTRQARGSAPPETWDEGVTAARLEYQGNHYRTSSAQSNYVGLRIGANLEGWQLRHSGNYSQSTGSETKYTSMDTYLRRNLVALKSSLTLGDSYTPGRMFDSFSLRGVQLASDERMLPDSQRGFAPVIRGRADSNARVEVRQSGQLLHETTVPPGPFEISDLYPTGFGGDLEVTVFEADGTSHAYSVPYSSGPNLLREGALRYSFAAGRHRQSQGDVNAVQLELSYGLSNEVTVAGGAQLATDYASGTLGVGLNTLAGAWSLDLTTASTTLPGNGRERGSSLRGGWSKVLGPTDTNFSLAAYRFSTEHYYGLNEAVSAYASRHGSLLPTLRRERGRVTLSMTQSLKGWGQIYAQGTRRTYWGLSGVNTSYQLGYSKNVGPATFNLDLSRETAIGSNNRSNGYNLSVILPLDRRASSTGVASASVSGRSGMGTSESIGYGGTALDNQLGYNLSASHGPSGNAAFASGNLRTAIARFNASTGRSSGANQTSVGMSGALVLHPGGATLASELGDTIGVVAVGGASEGVRLNDSNIAPPNARGYTVVPHLSAFQRNDLQLNLDRAALDVQMENTQASVVPTAGAVVMLKYQQDPGRTVVIASQQDNGQPLPFGATVLDELDGPVGAVGQGSRLNVHLRQAQGQLRVRWGSQAQESCAIAYTLPERVPGARLVELALPCDKVAPQPSAPQRPGAPTDRAAEVQPPQATERVNVSLRGPEGQERQCEASVSPGLAAAGASGQCATVQVEGAGSAALPLGGQS